MVTNMTASFLMCFSFIIFFAISFTVLNVAGTSFCSVWPSSTKARIKKFVTSRQTIIVTIQLFSVTQVNISSSIEKIEKPSRRPTFVPDDWIGPAHFSLSGSLFSIQLSAVMSFDESNQNTQISKVLLTWDSFLQNRASKQNSQACGNCCRVFVLYPLVEFGVQKYQWNRNYCMADQRPSSSPSNSFDVLRVANYCGQNFDRKRQPWQAQLCQISIWKVFFRGSLKLEFNVKNSEESVDPDLHFWASGWWPVIFRHRSLENCTKRETSISHIFLWNSFSSSSDNLSISLLVCKNFYARGQVMEKSSSNQ